VVSANASGTSGAPTLTPGNGTVDISWNVVSGATFNAERSTDGTNFSTVTGCLNISAISCTDAAASNGVLYFYHVITVYPGGLTSTSPSTAVTPGIVPSPPEGLSLLDNSTGTTVIVRFGDSPSASSYRIYLGTSSGVYTSSTAASANTNDTLSALVPGTTYYLAAVAFIGTVPSGYSNELVVTPVVAPTAPTAFVTAPTEVTVSWSAPGGISITGYDVLRSTDQVSFTTIKSAIAAGTTTYQDQTVAAGLTYYYKFRTSGPTPYIDSSISLPVTVGVIPETPLQLTAEATSTTSVLLGWGSIYNASQYNIYRGTSSGGPFAKIGSATALVNSYTDASAVAGSTYFYMVRADSPSHVESNDSNVVGVSLGALDTPTSLLAAAGVNKINLSWVASPAATGYLIRRSEVAGGPYGILASIGNTTSYSDALVTNGITYYYVVDALFAAGASSPDSSEASATALVTMNLQSAIELMDRGVASDQVPVTFERTRTSLDTNAYDGTVTYGFEVVALNADAASYSVQLLDTSNVSVATLVVPANTYSPTRIRVVFTPTPGANEYRIALPASTTLEALALLSGRIIVTQTNATKTKLYIPLLSSVQSPTHDDAAAYFESTSSNAYGDLPSAMLYQRDTSSLATLADMNAWEFEALASTTGGASGTVALYDLTAASIVDDTETTISSTPIGLVRAPFNEGTLNFASINEGDKYQVTVSCQTNCAANARTVIHKAGLWVTLSTLSKVEAIFRLSLRTNAMMTYDQDQERTLIDLTKFSSPSVYFQATGAVSGADPVTVQLMSAGNAEYGPSALTPVAGGALTFTDLSKSRVRTASTITPVSGDRLVPEVVITTGSFDWVSSAIIIRAYP
jgi:fibronectin type 3 domain-containing protein